MCQYWGAQRRIWHPSPRFRAPLLSSATPLYFPKASVIGGGDSSVWEVWERRARDHTLRDRRARWSRKRWGVRGRGHCPPWTATILPPILTYLSPDALKPRFPKPQTLHPLPCVSSARFERVPLSLPGRVLLLAHASDNPPTNPNARVLPCRGVGTLPRRCARYASATAPWTTASAASPHTSRAPTVSSISSRARLARPWAS